MYLYIINGFKIETMYVYYIVMEIYIFGYINKIYIVYVYLVCYTILLPWTTHKQHKNFSKLKSQFLSQFYYMKLYIHTTTYFYQVRVFPKLTNTHLYIIQKETKQEIS
jgi:hypothetical protein